MSVVRLLGARPQALDAVVGDVDGEALRLPGRGDGFGKPSSSSTISTLTGFLLCPQCGVTPLRRR